MIRTAFIGHRGTGKTSLLARVQTYFDQAARGAEFFDLDRAIEEHTSRNIQTFFMESGEASFREVERSVFHALDFKTASHEDPVFLAVGAGFDPQLIPVSWNVIWVRRATDANGRIFMDRPRLNQEVDALSEFHERFARREKAYAERANEIFWIEEGGEIFDGVSFDSTNEEERDYFLDQFRDLRCDLTLMPQNFRDRTRITAWLDQRVRWGVRWFELRDDLLTTEQMRAAIEILPAEQVLISFRAQDRTSDSTRLVEIHQFAFDWPVERGPCPIKTPRFLSLHARGEDESVEVALARFPIEIPRGCQLKAALPIRNFKELEIGHRWCEQLGEARIFLPMSDDGRWNWYRLGRGIRSGLNFVRESDGSNADQPKLLRWAEMRRLDNASESFDEPFAAVLGDPVAHSRTPTEQRTFFAEVGSLVHAIRVTTVEWESGALAFLNQLGLQWAAVTAPLKKLAFESSRTIDDSASALRSVNTLRWKNGIWDGGNTDLHGLSESLSELEGGLESLRKLRGRVAVWGGGGTLNVIRAVLPEAQLFSLRTSQNRRSDGESALELAPEVVIWAVGRSQAHLGTPPANWRPSLVFDLNYADDSPGREFALGRGSLYVSGLKMFRHQAKAQRVFWESAEEST